MSIDSDKTSASTKIKYKLKNALVFQSTDGYTFSKYLDKEKAQNVDSELDVKEVAKLKRYIESGLEYNNLRFENQAEIVVSFLSDGENLLDVGCGGGAFLKQMERRGYEIAGLEPERYRAKICRETLECEIYEHDVTEERFIKEKQNFYSAVTLWDVIEHVNYPEKTLKSIFFVIKPGGYIFIDTPAKDSFYHRFGEFSYCISRGRFPTFLNIMYSDHPYGHKQIFSTEEMQRILEQVGFNVVCIRKFHELSFPVEYYLEKLVNSKSFAKLFAPLAKKMVDFFRIRNKMLVVAYKNPQSRPSK